MAAESKGLVKGIFRSTFVVFILALSLITVPVGSVQAASGGPDGFGYRWWDFGTISFENMSDGNSVTLGDNELSSAVPIGFSFSFYGTAYTQAYIDSNGALRFTNIPADIGDPDALIPTLAAPNLTVYSWWADLNPGLGGTIKYKTTGTAPNRIFVVEFNEVPHFGGLDPVTFQIKLFETTNVIEVHYLKAPAANVAGTDRNHTAGIENGGGTIALVYNFGLNALADPLNPKTVIYSSNPAPTIGSITPSSGLNNGSVNITDLAGSGFLTGATVKLTKTGQTDINATGVTVVSGAKITCTFDLTGKASGLWNVVATNPDSQSATLANGFTVNNPAPTIGSITPSSGLNNGSVNITDLAGSGFLTGATVKLTKTGQTDISATGVTVVSGAKITCTFDLTGKATGLWNVVVTNTDSQSVTLANGFTVNNPAPTIGSITPSSGLNNGSVNITDLAGSGFLTGATVKLTKTGQTDINATGVTVVSGAKITCTFDLTGKATGPWNVVVTNTDSQSVTLANGFTVSNPAPTIGAITPSSGLNNGSVNITDLAGSGFLTGATVKLTKTGQTDINATGVTVVSGVKITCTFDLTGKATGLWNVVVTNTDSQSVTLANGFTVNNPAPTIGSITPSSGLNNGSVNITDLAGSGFLTGATVKLTKTGQTDINATGVTVVSGVKITCTFDLTGKATGPWNVVVTNTDSQSVTLANGFTVNNPAPTIGSITPSSGLNNGSVNITDLAGSGFLTGATVKLAKTGQTDINATGVTVVSGAKITCTFNLTGKASGLWNVVVTNTDSQSVTLANGFTVNNPAPTIGSITPSSGLNNGSVNITDLAGSGFLTGATVKLTKTGQTDINATGVTVVSGVKITCTFDLTGAEAGPWNVVVTNTDTQAHTLSDGFTVMIPIYNYLPLIEKK